MSARIDPSVLSSIIGLIYDVSIGTASWEQVIEAICRNAGIAAGALGKHDSSMRTSVTLANWGTPEAYDKAFNETYGLVSPFPAAMMLAPVGKVVRPFELFGRETVVQERFFREWCTPQQLDDFIGATVARRPRQDFVLGFARRSDQKPFDAELETFLSLLMPHVTRSLHISGLIGSVRAERDDLAALLDTLAIPALLIEADMKLSYLNQAAIGVLEAGTLFSVRANALRIADERVDAELRRAMSQGKPYAAGLGDPIATSVTAVPLRRPSGEAAALFFSRKITDLPPPAEPLVATFGLTPAELRILLLLMMGFTPEAAARDLGVKVTSIRTHMTNIFRKTDTTRQADLIAKAVALMAPVSSEHWKS